ncbi:MAG TPA: hypothetical protein VGG03_24250 [Thermoanaerobaculia bacterium]|jgi:hypothetical protein
MIRNTTHFVSMRRTAVAALALTFGLAIGSPAWADPICKAVHSRVDLAAGDPTCGSAIGLCAGGMLYGNLKGNSEFVGTSFAPSVDTAATGVVLLTGDNTIHTQDGDIFTKDAIVLATTGAGEFAEVDTIVGGTGVYAGASGKFTATGTFANGAGVGVLVGEICVP